MESLRNLCMNNVIKQIFDLPPLMVDEILLESTNAMKIKIQEEIEHEVKINYFQKISNECMEQVCFDSSVIIPFMVSDMVKSAVENVPRQNYLKKFKKFTKLFIEHCETSAEFISRTCIIERMETGEDNFYNEDSDSETQYYYEEETERQVFFTDEDPYSP
jgi:hypothetical protein